MRRLSEASYRQTNRSTTRSALRAGVRKEPERALTPVELALRLDIHCPAATFVPVRILGREGSSSRSDESRREPGEPILVWPVDRDVRDVERVLVEVRDAKAGIPEGKGVRLEHWPDETADSGDGRREVIAVRLRTVER